MQQFEQSIGRYLAELDQADRDPAMVLPERVTRLQEKAAKIKRQMHELSAIEQQLAQALDIKLWRLSLEATVSPAPARRISRWEQEEILKKVQARLDSPPEASKLRRRPIEHVFGAAFGQCHRRIQLTVRRFASDGSAGHGHHELDPVGEAPRTRAARLRSCHVAERLTVSLDRTSSRRRRASPSHSRFRRRCCPAKPAPCSGCAPHRSVLSQPWPA